MTELTDNSLMAQGPESAGSNSDGSVSIPGFEVTSASGTDGEYPSYETSPVLSSIVEAGFSDGPYTGDWD